MFIGHFAPAFVAASLGPRAPKLGTVFVAAQLVDWAFFGLAIVGVEKVGIEPGITKMVPLDLYYYPFTHSLAGSAIWALGFALVVTLWQRNANAGLLAGVVVLSHWILDWVAHRPDLTIAGGEARYGLGLWNHPEILIPLEVGITLAAFFFYLRRSRGPVGPPMVLIGTLLLFQAINWFGPEPDGVTLLFLIQPLIAFGVLTAIAAWVGENRYFVRAGGLAAPSA
ncbi:MAG: hypothetical protein AAF127_01150 [Pseudomonadota bacterium]